MLCLYRNLICPLACLACLQKDPKRLERLQHNAAFTGGSIIDAQQADFLGLDPEAPQYQAVRAVLLDPSCSGSGTSFSRMDYLLPSSADRLKGGWGWLAGLGASIVACAYLSDWTAPCSCCHAVTH